MSISRLLALGAVACALTACGAKNAPSGDADAAAEATTPPPAAEQTAIAPAATQPATIPAEAAIPADTIATAFGKGNLERDDGKMASFTVDVNFRSSKKVGGNIVYTSFLDEGKVELTVDVDCGHYDINSKRAWFGGKISDNRSNHSAYKEGRFAIGQSAWFRFEESDTHPEPAAKVSDLHFAGDADINSSADFCRDKPWSEDGLRDLSAQGAVIIFALPEAS